MELSNKFGSVFVQSVKDKLEQTYGAVKEAVPFVGQVEEFYAGTEDRANTRLLERGFSQEQIDAANAEKQKYTQTGEATSQFLDTVSDVTNIDRDLVGGAAFAAEMVLDARMGARMTLDTATGVARVMPAQPVQALTIKDPKFLAAGMRQDVSKTAKFAPTVKVYDERTQAYADLVADYTDSFSKGNISADRLKKNLAKVEKNRKGDTSTFEYDPDNPVAYTESISSSFNPYLSTPKYQGLRKDKPRGLVAERLGEVVQEDPYDIAKKAQQHHVLAKAETKVFADVLNNLISKGIADKDDLVNFFVWPEQYDLFPGNVLKNLLDMGEITHTVAKKDPMALHTILAQAGLEFGSNTNAQIIKRYGLDKIETADDLMKAYDRYLQEIAIPSKDITYKVQDYWIDKTRKTLKGQELIDFNNRVSKLNDPRKPL